MSTLNNVRERIESGKSLEQIRNEQNTESAFWFTIVVAATFFLAVGAWKYFFYLEQVDIPSNFWQQYLIIEAGFASEVFRLASLILAYYEAKQGRVVSVWFGILTSIVVMAFDIRIGYMFDSQAALSTYIFFCWFGELIGIRAIFGRAFEDTIAKWLGYRLSQKVVTTMKPKNQQTTTTVTQDKTLDMSEWFTVNGDEVLVKGFKNPFTAKTLKWKIGEYKSKNKSGVGKKTTNDFNIKKLQAALKELTKS